MSGERDQATWIQTRGRSKLESVMKLIKMSTPLVFVGGGAPDRTAAYAK